MSRSHTQRDIRIGPTTLLVVGLMVLVALLFALWTTSVRAAADSSALAYVTGGIGADEMARLKARENEFNLKLVFTLVEGNYLSDVVVAVRDVTGKPLLSVNAQGPIFLVKLPRGSYVVEATYAGKAQIRKISVGERLRTEYLRWPSNPETDFPGPKAND